MSGNRITLTKSLYCHSRALPNLRDYITLMREDGFFFFFFFYALIINDSGLSENHASRHIKRVCQSLLSASSHRLSDRDVLEDRPWSSRTFPHLPVREPTGPGGRGVRRGRVGSTRGDEKVSVDLLLV